MQQLTLFEEYDQLENLHEDNMIHLDAFNCWVRFRPTSSSIHDRRIDLYCSTRNQLSEIKNELAKKGWSLMEGSFPSSSVSFTKSDMLIKIYEVFG